MSKNKTKKKKGGFINALLTIGIIACICVFAFSAYKLFVIYQDYKVGEDEYSELQQYAKKPTNAPEGKTEGSTSQPGSESGSESGEGQETLNYQPPEVDFESLQAINPDVVGWIDVEALNISYPIVKGKDNDEYLHRTFEKKDNFAGSIFMDYLNNADFNDCNTLIYGHNMKNQSMFGKLKFIKEQEKYKKSMYFWVITSQGKYRYEIFSAHVTKANGDTYTLFDGPGEQFLDYLNKMASQSQIPTSGRTMTMEDKIVTLTTCTSDDTERFVVQGVRVLTI